MSADLQTPAGAPLYAAMAGSAIPISDSEVLFMAQLGEKERASGMDHRHVMTFDVHAAFVECAEFAPLAVHTQHLQERFPKLGKADIERVLGNFVQRGLLQSEHYLRERLASRGARHPGKLSAMAIISPGHPAALEAMLASVAEAAPARDRGFALMDTSEEPEHRARKVELMAEFGRRTGQRVVLLEQKRERWLGDRISQFPEHEAGLQRLLGKEASGRSRALNFIATAFAGERVLVVDDCIRLRTYGQAGGSIHLGAPARRHAQVYPNSELALASRPRAPSLWDIAENGLGMGMAGLVAGVDVRGRALEEFQDYEHARVARLALGVLGSADTRHSFWGLTLDGAQQAQLKTREDVLNALSGDSVSLCAREATLAPPVGMAACGFDFSAAHGFAVGDAEDAERSLAALSLFADSGAMELNLPIALERRGPAQTRSSVNREPLQLSSARFFADHVRQLQSLCFAGDASARWRWLAVQCLDLAEAPAAERELILWRYTTAKRAELLGELQRHLAAIPAQGGQAPSEPWRHELISVIQAQASGLLHSNHPGLTGFDSRIPVSEAFANELRSYAQMALAWGAIWSDAPEHRLP